MACSAASNMKSPYAVSQKKVTLFILVTSFTSDKYQETLTVICKKKTVHIINADIRLMENRSGVLCRQNLLVALAVLYGCATGHISVSLYKQ